MMKTFSHRVLSLAAILLVAVSASLLSGCARSVSNAELHERDGGDSN